MASGCVARRFSQETNRPIGRRLKQILGAREIQTGLGKPLAILQMQLMQGRFGAQVIDRNEIYRAPQACAGVAGMLQFANQQSIFTFRHGSAACEDQM